MTVYDFESLHIVYICLALTYLYIVLYVSLALLDWLIHCGEIDFTASSMYILLIVLL